MNCNFCKDTGKIKKPKDQERFDHLVDAEIEKGYFVNYNMAEKKAFDIVGYDVVDCPYCSPKKQ